MISCRKNLWHILDMQYQYLLWESTSNVVVLGWQKPEKEKTFGTAKTAIFWLRTVIIMSDGKNSIVLFDLGLGIFGCSYKEIIYVNKKQLYLKFIYSEKAT